MFWSFHVIFLPNVNGSFPRTAVMATSNSTRLLRYTCCHLILYFIRHQGVSPRGSHYPSDPHLNSAAAKIPHELPTYRHQMYPDAFSSWSNSYKNKLFFLCWCFIKFACHMTNNGYALILTTNIQIITKACDKEQCHCIALYLNLL